MIWNPEIETASRNRVRAVQWERLLNTANHVYKNVPFYRERLNACHLPPERWSSPGDLQKIPFTTKEDLRSYYPYGLFAVPRKEVVRIHASSGTTGKPTVVGYTRADLDMWSECVARLVCMAGGRSGDIAQISFGYGLFTGALGLHYGLEKVGAAVIPISSGNTEKQLMVMQDFETTILVCTPSYALYLSETAEKLGIDLEKLSLRIGMFGGEGHTLEMSKEIERRLGILVTENYGLSEVLGPGVSGECPYKTGMHINEDYFLLEIIDPVTGEVLPDGAEGELVITTLKKEAFPIIRYRTRDITSLHYERCECGRTSARMAKVKGRSDDMLIIKGVNVYPSQVESVIVGMEHISPYYQLVVKKDGYTDVLEVHVELVDDKLLESFSELEKLEKTVKAQLYRVLGLDCHVRLREPGTMERTAGKAKRVLDLR
ncbi:MAG: phenylacetate--CoA ligase [Clostridiales bacterium]|jgi:phenylacetate-CoA ligase|nr:phenylacetate--CoA ligase [Clostridiales bacterium]